MVTFFTTAKPFKGHSAIIQRNALKSWTLLDPDAEVILFGDDEGAADTARDLRIRHEPHVEKNEFGTKRLDYFFDRAQEIAKHAVLCYANCDILLMNDFAGAVKRAAAGSNFLMVGRRWDTDVTEPLDFSNPQWERELLQRAVAANQQRDEWWIDYFVFSRGIFHKKMPQLVIGRVYWDNWLIWKAKKSGHAVIDASEAVTAVHQNHDYGYHPEGKEGVWNDEQSRRNFELAGGYGHLRTIASANYRLTANGLKRIPMSWRGHLRTTFLRRTRSFRAFWRTRVWHPFLDATRSARHAVGLKKGPQAARTGARKDWNQ